MALPLRYSFFGRLPFQSQQQYSLFESSHRKSVRATSAESSWRMMSLIGCNVSTRTVKRRCGFQRTLIAARTTTVYRELPCRTVLRGRRPGFGRCASVAAVELQFLQLAVSRNPKVIFYDSSEWVVRCVREEPLFPGSTGRPSIVIVINCGSILVPTICKM